jgi:hypothetical protein
MDLEAELLREHSKNQARKITRWIGGDQRRLKMLMDLFLTGEFVVAQRASMVISTLTDHDPLMLRRYLKPMLSRAQEPGVHDAVRRSIVRLLQYVQIPGSLLGTAANVCFELLASADAPIAVKCNAMTVLANIAKKEPELGRELQLVIEQQLPYAGAGFRARAREILNELKTESFSSPSLPRPEFP